MRNAGGYAIIVGENDPRETDTFTCAHCNKITHCWQQPLDSIGGFCRMCMKMVCAECAGKSCDPFEKKLERWEKSSAG